MDIPSSDSETHITRLNDSPNPEPLFPEQRLINRRQLWANNRFRMEMENLKTRRYGNRGRHHWYELLFMMKTLGLVLHLTHLHRKGVRNAENIILREIPLYFANLPHAFEGFTILHLSDLHLDGMKGIEDRILRVLENRTVDLCVLTGDYRTKLHGLHKHIIQSLEYLIKHIHSKHGFIGILGNHDGCHMLNPMEQIGITMLVNAACFVYQGNDRIRIIGTDDVHYYYTDQALHALEHADNEFSIALIHSPELYDVAAEMGVDLYLCGHTHAGQICLPGGRAILVHLNRGRKYYHGHWNHLEMQGITHAGTGTSGIPVRFNTRGEVLIHHLHRQPAP
ncbi:MAG: metallophosphoesterase [Proteobacteria bacterium]|nr:metallophosphoesterase [Pseudomonadota bacterium]